MNEIEKTTDKPTPTDWQALWPVAGPYIEKIANALLGTLERSQKNTGVITGCLLGMIVLCFTGIAVYALYLNHVDTSEKVMIALISFLGGAAMFSGTPKK